ncbi:MAG: PQQ-dependent dehydrogenase, methanol/ethanol family [Betaproteobacteria bacterium]|nr:MAG: PQQ-dependent dehydrogenase, methanol/ethanol family [Betaproteobacteria bacterium]
MKPLATASAVLLLVAGAAGAQTLDELKNDGRFNDATRTDNVLTYGMGYHQQRYSPLNQINRNTIKRLVPVWSVSLDNNWGEQAQPIVYQGVMYVTNARHTVAIDVASGKQLWRHTLDWPADTPRVVCCGVSNKGAAIYNGRIYRTTLDAHVMALDAKTGKELWKTKVAEWKDGYSLTVAPLIANGVLITGISGAEFGIRGFIDGWDPETGKQLWRRYTIPARGEKGNDTWPQDNNAWEIGGGSAWITGSYDPQLDLMYWGIGNPAPWASQSRAGDNLYTSSVLAMRPKTGEIVWHYQFTPNDAYDYDACWELILAELKIGGKARKVAMQLNRNGFLYVFDRATGELLSAKAYEKVNWASHVDMKSGRPVETEIAKSIREMKATEHWPSTRGAKNWQHAAFNPHTGLLYANTMHEGRMYKHLETKPYERGQRYQFIENLPLPRAAGEPIGHIEAIDPLTAEKKWRVPLTDFQIWSAMLASGELLFTGKETGEFIALDAATGKQVWQFQTSSGINAMPITYSHKGRQYVTVLSGIGGLYWNINRESLKDKVPQGGSVWTFALLPE